MMGKAIVSGGAVMTAPARPTLSRLAVGSTLSLNVNGVAKEFIVVHQGKPSTMYDDSCDGTWLLMKDIYEKRAWHSSNVNSYKASTIHTYLNGTFLGLFDADVQNIIKQAKIPYVNGTGGSAVASGSSGLSAKIFLLGGYEVGNEDNSRMAPYIPIDGACLSYFGDTTDLDGKRIGYLNGSALSWWLRSPYTGDTTGALRLFSDGGIDYNVCTISSYGIRPALILPSDLLLQADGTIKL